MSTPAEQMDNADHGDQQPQGPSEAEIQAQRTGWQPKDKFKGDPEKWRPAEEWNQRAEEFIPIARAENRRLQERLEKIERENAEKDEIIRASKQFMTGIEERAKVAAIESLRAERREALKNGDAEAFDIADAKLKEVEAPPRQEQQRPQMHPEAQSYYQTFMSENKEWYEGDPEVKEFADSVVQTLQRQGFNPTVSRPAMEDFLAKVKDKTMRAYPEKFGRRNGNRSPMFEGAAGGQRQQSGKKTFESMKPEFQQACDKFVKSGMVKSRESYVALAPPDAFY